MKKDHYALLGVAKSAKPREIQRAYLKLARRRHPDVNPGDRKAVTEFRRIQEAYRTLADPAARKAYDSTGQSAPPAGERAGKKAKAPPASELRGWENIFRDIFQEEKVLDAADVAERGEDIHQVLEISFADSLSRTKRHVAYQREVFCSHCGGRRYEPGTVLTDCPDCEGSGLVSLQRGPYRAKKICHRCAGTGEAGDTPCTVCQGKGRLFRNEKELLTLPPGIDSGSRVVIPAGGQPGKGGGESGDLVVTVRVSPHPSLERRGYNLYTSVLVTVAEAALGTTILVPAAEGKASLEIPPGTQSGEQLGIRGRGVPRRGAKAGDLYVSVQVVVPAAKDAKSRRLFREIEKIFPENPRLRG